MIVWLAEATSDGLLRAATRRITETRGGLFGYATASAIVVDGFTVARGRTSRTATTFCPDAADLQAQIDATIRTSAGRRYLVGEWHTHPTGRPHLSSTDTASVKRTAANERVGLDRPVAIVLAPTAVLRRQPHLGAYVWDPAAARPTRTQIRVFDSRDQDSSGPNR